MKSKSNEQDSSRDIAKAPEKSKVETPKKPPDRAKLEKALAIVRDAYQSGDEEQLNAVLSVTYSFIGPLPPPGMLGQYGDVVNDGAERIIKNWETESDHRRNIVSRGQFFALVIALSTVAAASFGFWLGHPIAGASVVIASMVGLGLIGALKIGILKK